MNRRSLGLTISETRGTTEFIAPLGHYSHRLKTDFAVLEALLNLFAILLPSFSAPQKRTSYIQDVFFNSGNDVINLLDRSEEHTSELSHSGESRMPSSA